VSPACYTAREIQQRLKMSRTTFNDLKRAGKLPFLEELKPRLGGVIRYRADLVERYLAGQWGQPRLLRRHA
jgi:Helix-turn-helix domain